MQQVCLRILQCGHGHTAELPVREITGMARSRRICLKIERKNEMMKRETPEEWDRREQELEAMGFKGGQGRSNHEVYETAGICSWVFGMLAIFILSMLTAGIVQKIIGA